MSTQSSLFLFRTKMKEGVDFEEEEAAKPQHVEGKEEQDIVI